MRDEAGGGGDVEGDVLFELFGGRMEEEVCMDCVGVWRTTRGTISVRESHLASEGRGSFSLLRLRGSFDVQICNE